MKKPTLWLYEDEQQSDLYIFEYINIYKKMTCISEVS